MIPAAGSLAVPIAESGAIAAEAAPAKVNLHLHLTGRRPDGYHTLDSLVVFAPLAADRIEAVSATALTLAVDGIRGSELSAGEDNLVLRAARALASAAPGQGVALRLGKTLPVASGIGGGSADAAATLRLLTRLWRLDPAIARARALSLGADVPVCLEGRPALMRGVGEVLLPAPGLPPFALLLVNPGVAVATGAVFRLAREAGLRPEAVFPSGWADASALCRDLAAATANDLELPARRLVPVIGDVLARIRDTASCLLARMSGSGATCFGIYPDLAAAEAASAALAPTGWWRRASPAG